MDHIDSRRPSQTNPDHHGLLSLWDLMLQLYGYELVVLLRQLRVAQAGLQNILDGDAQAKTPKLDGFPENFPALVVQLASSIAEKLDLQSTKHQIKTLLRDGAIQMPLEHFLDDIAQLRVRLEEDLQSKYFLFVSPGIEKYWEQKDLFGLGKNFPGAHKDIESAGNCLVVGQGTACVFHLMRAMEVAVRKLSKRLKITITPQTTWRQLTGHMDGTIKAMPEDSQAKKAKKNAWEAARANLHHIGSVWRNGTMHPAKSYTPSQALDVFNAVRVFMGDLCAL